MLLVARPWQPPWQRFSFNLVLRAFVVLLRVLLHLPPSDDEMIVFAVASPWAGRHVTDFDKLPVDDVGWRETEIIAHSGRNVQTSSVVNIWLGTLISEDVLKMIGEKRATILPLRITRAIAFPNRNPTIPAYRSAPPPYTHV